MMKKKENKTKRRIDISIMRTHIPLSTISVDEIRLRFLFVCLVLLHSIIVFPPYSPISTNFSFIASLFRVVGSKWPKQEANKMNISGKKTAKAAQMATQAERKERKKKVLVLKRRCPSKCFVIDIISGRFYSASLSASVCIAQLRFGIVAWVVHAHGLKSVNICYCQCGEMAVESIFAIDMMQNIHTFQMNWWRKKSQNQLFCGSFYDICTHMFPLRVHTICLPACALCAL